MCDCIALRYIFNCISSKNLSQPIVLLKECSKNFVTPKIHCDIAGVIFFYCLNFFCYVLCVFVVLSAFAVAFAKVAFVALADIDCFARVCACVCVSFDMYINYFLYYWYFFNLYISIVFQIFHFYVFIVYNICVYIHLHLIIVLF